MHSFLNCVQIKVILLSSLYTKYYITIKLIELELINTNGI